MLRHSASQVFGSKHPALTRASANDDRTPPPAWMWGVGSGNSTMIVTQQRQQSQETPQTSAQYEAAAAAQDPSPFAPGASMMSTMTTTTATPYRTSSAVMTEAEEQQRQQEAEAEDRLINTALEVAVEAAEAAAHGRSASSLHPVFFTERLHRSTFVVLVDAAAAAAVTSPVAHGYVYHVNQRRADGAIPAML